jgi:hypothetical protein
MALGPLGVNTFGSIIYLLVGAIMHVKTKLFFLYWWFDLHQKDLQHISIQFALIEQYTSNFLPKI